MGGMEITTNWSGATEYKRLGTTGLRQVRRGGGRGSCKSWTVVFTFYNGYSRQCHSDTVSTALWISYTVLVPE